MNQLLSNAKFFNKHVLIILFLDHHAKIKTLNYFHHNLHIIQGKNNQKFWSLAVNFNLNFILQFARNSSKYFWRSHLNFSGTFCSLLDFDFDCRRLVNIGKNRKMLKEINTKSHVSYKVCHNLPGIPKFHFYKSLKTEDEDGTHCH